MAFDDTEEAAIPDAAEYTAGAGTPAPPQQPADNSGMGPVEAVPTDDSGFGPVAPSAAAPQGAPAQQGGQPKRFGPLGRIVSYLMGEGADNPAVLDQAAVQADPGKTMSKSDANLLAVEQAGARGGDEAAWKLVQANRVAYNAKQAFAYAALNGTQQKPPDVNAAVDAANQAAEHVLDGSNVKFMASQAGQITATVTPQGGGQPQIIDLSPDQFRQYLNVGGAGQWDKVMNATLPKALQNLVSGAGRQMSTPPQARMRTPPGQQAPAPQEDNTLPASEPDRTNFGETPSTINLSGTTRHTTPEPDIRNYSAELEARARRAFPNQGPEMERWMQQQEGLETDRENKVEIAKNTNTTREKIAETGAGAKKDVAGIQGETAKAVATEKGANWRYASDAKKAAAQIAADAKLAAQGNKEAQERRESARKMIAIKRQTAEKLTPAEEVFEKSLTDQGQQAMSPRPTPAAQAPAPQQQAPAASQPSGNNAAAMQWLKDNPDDPRAAAVRKKLGTQ